MLDSNKLGGFECPVCKGFIPVRIEELVVSVLSFVRSVADTG